MGQESAEEWTAQTDLQPGHPKSDRLLGRLRVEILGLALRLEAETDAVALTRETDNAPPNPVNCRAAYGTPAACTPLAVNPQSPIPAPT